MPAKRRVIRAVFILAGIFALLSAVVLLAFPDQWFFGPRTRVSVRSRDSAKPLLPKSTLRVGTYNIAHGRGPGKASFRPFDQASYRKRLDSISRFLASQDLDLLVLNEADFDCPWSFRVNQAQYIARRAGFPHVALQANYELVFFNLRVAFGNALLSRYPISHARMVRFPRGSLSPWLLFGKKEGMVATIQVPGTRGLNLFAVHLDAWSRNTRMQSARKILDIRREGSLPFVAAGDFNSTRLGFPGARPAQSGQTALSLLLGQGGWHTLPQNKPGPEEMTFSSTRPGKVIDWILVPDGWKVASKTVPNITYSDHRPVVMELDLSASPGLAAMETARERAHE